MAGQCELCLNKSEYISDTVGVCLSCVRRSPAEALAVVEVLRRQNRFLFDLPEAIPREKEGETCDICVNRCRVPEGGRGYCGLQRGTGGAATSREANFRCFREPLPANCTAAAFCPGGSGAGYPEYSPCGGPETGFRNIGVFFQACNFDCLYCQNRNLREFPATPSGRSLRAELLGLVDERTNCISFFGGDPVPELPSALAAAEEAVRKKPGGIMRICWETNGAMEPAYLRRMVELSRVSGGCVKFDLKAWGENLHRALTGTGNRRVFENFLWAAGQADLRPDPPLLIAATCLVPGYIDEREVGKIAEFIASINPDTPYVLLGFLPAFLMADLPGTPRSFGEKCLQIARGKGLTRVRLENFDP